MSHVARELGSSLRQLNRGLRLLKQRSAGRLGQVPAGAFALLEHVEDGGTCHGKTLAARAGLDPSTVSRAVTALVGHGLVDRQPDPSDGRASVFTLTAEGRAALEDARRWFGTVLDRALADWTADDVAVLCAVLGRFAGDVDRTLDNNRLEAAR